MIKDLLKFSTAGSVDDGKSTLIGRLLHDTRSIYEDQLEAIARASKKTNAGSLDLALLTDGLRAEREQGITIDVAYRYFSSPSRKYILSDSPGHVQFTRNMVTAVCGSDLVILILDARHGLKEQTRRHTFIAEFLGIKHLIVCINKMDLVDFSEEAYEGVCADFRSFSSKTKIPEIHFIPVSALLGDNIFEKSERMHWYDGPTLFYLLENIQVHSDHDWVNCRFPVQTVIRSRHAQDGGRAYAGRLAAGKLKKEDEVVILPSGID
jgi:sulfate adenylyltransferase subunit 1